MAHHYTKAGLYTAVNKLRGRLEISWEDYPLDLRALCGERGSIQTALLPFRTEGLKGMSVIGSEGESDVILINQAVSWEEQNFICAHELLHLTLHRDAPARSFRCFERALPNQDGSQEWQANEGAAELLVPAALLFPAVRRSFLSLEEGNRVETFRKETAQRFRVVEAVVTYRLESLKYELSQYLAGVPREQIRCLSHRQQEKLGIEVESLNDRARRLAGQNSERLPFTL